MHFSPEKWSGQKPLFVDTNNQKALYSCRAPWLLKGAHGDFKMPCRKCGSCLGNRKNDLVGRMLAEAMSCYDVWVCTFTYDDKRLIDEEEDGSVFRFPNHIAKAVNALRMQGQRAMGHRIDVSYFAVWETGSQRGRGHWHVIFFWRTQTKSETLESCALGEAKTQNARPVWMPKTNEEYLHPAAYGNVLKDATVVDLMGGKRMRQEWSIWPHGKVTVHAQFRGGHTTPHVHSSFAYCVDYVTKEKQRYLMSHGLGEAFFRSLIRQKVSAGVKLNDLTYTFGDQRKLAHQRDRLKEKRSADVGRLKEAKNRPRVYQIQGVMRQRCISYAIKLHRHKVKERYRKLLPKWRLKPRDISHEIRSKLSIQSVGPAAERWQWERMRYAANSTSENLRRLEDRAANDQRLADELADIGYNPRSQTENMVDADGPQFRQPPLDTEGARARLRALAPKQSKARRSRAARSA